MIKDDFIKKYNDTHNILIRKEDIKIISGYMKCHKYNALLMIEQEGKKTISLYKIDITSREIILVDMKTIEI